MVPVGQYRICSIKSVVETQPPAEAYVALRCPRHCQTITCCCDFQAVPSVSEILPNRDMAEMQNIRSKIRKFTFDFVQIGVMYLLKMSLRSRKAGLSILKTRLTINYSLIEVTASER